MIAFARGFISEVLGIAGWVGAFFAANAAAPELRPVMRGWLGNADLADPAAYAVAFLVALVVLSILTGMIGGAVRNSMLGGVDRTLGLVFGLARGLLVLAVAYVGTGLVVPTDRWPEAVAEARSIPYVYRLATSLAEFLPPDYRPHVPMPPQGRDTTAADLLQPTPQGRATARP